MKTIFGMLFLLGSVAAQLEESNQVPILSYSNENNYDGSYQYSYEAGNGISVQEEGYVKNPGDKDLEAQTARGRYSYTAPDGQVITVTWYADETGFHAEGSHIPQVGGQPPVAAQPPVPQAQGQPAPGEPEIPPVLPPSSATFAGGMYRGK